MSEEEELEELRNEIRFVERACWVLIAIEIIKLVINVSRLVAP